VTRENATVLVVVRHGETEWNVEGRMQGHLDIPMSARGMRQAQAVAGALASERIDAVYSSDLVRALALARTVAGRLGLDVTADARLRERALGVAEGLTDEELRLRHPEVHAPFRGQDADYAPPGGESTRERHERSVAVGREIAARHPGARVLVVTHYGVVRSLCRHALALGAGDPLDAAIGNGSISRFLVEGGRWRLISAGDAAHLDGGPRHGTEGRCPA